MIILLVVAPAAVPGQIRAGTDLTAPPSIPPDGAP
jgi:hypothetical protein